MTKQVVHYLILIVFFHLILAQTEINQDEANNSALNQKVNDIVDKINSIVKYVQSKSMHESKEKLLKNIEIKLMKAAKFLGSKGKENVQLIMEGIKIKTSNITDSTRKSKNTLNKSNKKKQKSLVELAHEFDIFIKTKLKQSTIQNKNILVNDIKHNEQNEIINNTKRTEKLSAKSVGTEDKEKHDTVGDNEDYFKTTDIPKSLTANVDICYNVFNSICSRIKLLYSFKCQYVDVSISLENLCNNYIDCPDRSDEKYCSRHVTNKVEEANRIMTDVELSFNHKCFEENDKTSILRKHSETLRDLLLAQTNFKEKFQNLGINLGPDVPNHSNISDSQTVKRIVNEISLIISSLALTLNGAFCSHKQENRRTFDDIFNKNPEQEFREVIWPPKSCDCKKELCIDCSDTCKRVCWHKYSLNRWNCESINITDSVSMNAICDGKLDCYDESDEKDCDIGTGFAKFEAHDFFGNTIKMLQSRASKEKPSIRIKIISLKNMITKLQEKATKSGNDRVLIKKLRTKCYSIISSLYLDMLRQSHFVNDSEEAYLFLLSVNKNLAAALKRSTTGNKKIISDGCYCRDDACVVSLCPRSCVKSCSVESKIINFRCQGDNISISSDNICDGNQNCPNGYDELECREDEICRPHHLVVLRRRLQDVEKKFKGTSLGEILGLWKTKVISTLKVAEKSSRPKPKALRRLVKNILRDLVLTYGTVEDYRRSDTDYALDDFITIAQQVMTILKSCGK